MLKEIDLEGLCLWNLGMFRTNILDIHVLFIITFGSDSYMGFSNAISMQTS